MAYILKFAENNLRDYVNRKFQVNTPLIDHGNASVYY